MLLSVRTAVVLLALAASRALACPEEASMDMPFFGEIILASQHKIDPFRMTVRGGGTSFLRVEPEALPALIAAHFPARADREGLFGHSMGGHGALVCALRQPGRYRSVSAFAPICAPMRVPWGQKAFRGYLGEDTEAWRAYDATELHLAQALMGQLRFAGPPRRSTACRRRTRSPTAAGRAPRRPARTPAGRA